MLRKILQKVTLTALLAGPIVGQVAQPIEKPTSQPTVKAEVKEEGGKVNALGATYSYKTKAEAKLAEKLLEVVIDMQNKHGAKPYVWGGDGFESLEEQNKLYKDSVTSKQPSGSWRAGQPTVPGVDCSGLVFQIEKTLGFSYGRLTAQGYAEKTKPIIKATKDVNVVIKQSRPADLIFFIEGGKAVHVQTYLGNGFVVESVGTRDDISAISPGLLEEWRKYARPEKCGKSDRDYGGLQIIDLNKKPIDKKYTLALHRWNEFLSEEEKAQPKKK